MGVLNHDQFVYEVGDEEYDAPERGYRSTRYGPEHEVHPTEMGMPVVPSPSMRYSNIERIGEERDLPLDRVSLSQSYVYAPHVRNLATIPGEAFHKTQAHDPVDADETPEGYVISHGAHRTTAARLRGDTTIRAKVSMRFY